MTYEELNSTLEANAVTRCVTFYFYKGTIFGKEFHWLEAPS